MFFELYCKCDKNEAQEFHSCPYQEDIQNNNDPEYCNCCDDCVQDCLDSI